MEGKRGWGRRFLLDLGEWLKGGRKRRSRKGGGGGGGRGEKNRVMSLSCCQLFISFLLLSFSLLPALVESSCLR